jgi:tRNA threonylcarbamoyladenosine biosynthesis protein TsaB
MNILSIDTSTSAGSIVLARNDRLVAEVNIDSQQTHSSRLLRGIEVLLDGCGLTLNEIEAFAVLCGPGSFTGIRIGLATVKGLADSLSRPTIPVTGFEAWVEKYRDRPGILIPMIDARRGEVYGSVVQRTGEETRVLCQGVVEKADRFLSSIVHEEAFFIGGGAEVYKDLIASKQRTRWVVMSDDPFLGRAINAIAWRRAQQGTFVSAAALEAYYLRRSDAELKWKEK